MSRTRIQRGIVRLAGAALIVAVALGVVGSAAARPPTMQPRPALSGPEYTHGTAHFLIHYTFGGIDAVPAADLNGNSTPDWVEEVGRVMERIWDAEINTGGWPAPIPDKGEGGDERFDIYLMELFSKNMAGYVSPDGGFVGDNPATPRTESQAAYGYLVLENDFVDPSPPSGLKVWPPDDWLRIIAAHEFNHVLQIGINGSHSMNWWYESTANWMETQVFPDLPDNLESAGAVFKSPDTCMLRYGGVNRVESGLHWYGMWVFNQSISEQYGPGIVRDIWLAMADGYGYAPFDEVFAARGTSFDDELRRFALNVLLRNFEHGTAYPTARLQDAVSAPGEWTPVDGVQRYAMDYFGLDLPGTYTVVIESEDPGIEGIVVGMRGSSADVFPAGREVTVDFGGYDHAYLIVLNLTRPPNEAGCATARYTFAVQDAGKQPTGAAYSVEAPSFESPRVEAVTDPEDVPIFDPFYETEYNIREEIRQVDLPFNPIVPRGKPSGYELDSVYGINADEQGAEFVQMNAPSGGVVAQMLYYNRDGQLIRITESPTIYVTIGEWMAVNGLEFQPGVEVWTTGNVDTAVIDRSGGGGGPYLVAFIVRERFLAIDGDAPRDVMLDMAARFAASTSSDLPEPRQPIWDVYAARYE
ncbi:MAG: hypothetical protein JXJ20_00110 [Anaerolineae bacterium]|nr:hypothetical protein [Anaerolineae bacterium]